MSRVLSVWSVVPLVATLACKGPGEAARPPASPSPPPAPVRIEFKPAAGKTLTERSLTVRTEAFTTPDRKGSPFKESVAAMLKSRFEPAAGGAWTLTQQVTGVKVERNGQPLENRLVDVVTRFPMKVELAADGAFGRYLNPEAAETAVREVFNKPGEAEALLPYFSTRALEEQSRHEWESRYGGLFNRNLAPGTAFYGLETMGLTSGEQLAYGVERKVVGTTPTPYGEALVLKLRCLGSLEPGPAGEALAKLMERQEVKQLEPSVQCEGEQRVVGAPFAPVSSVMKLSARPKAPDGSTPVDIGLERSVALQRIE